MEIFMDDVVNIAYKQKGYAIGRSYDELMTEHYYAGMHAHESAEEIMEAFELHLKTK